MIVYELVIFLIVVVFGVVAACWPRPVSKLIQRGQSLMFGERRALDDMWYLGVRLMGLGFIVAGLIGIFVLIPSQG